jgi:hypothetical protein
MCDYLEAIVERAILFQIDTTTKCILYDRCTFMATIAPSLYF